MAEEPTREELSSAMQSPCTCPCAHCTGGTHCGRHRTGCYWSALRTEGRNHAAGSEPGGGNGGAEPKLYLPVHVLPR